MAGGQLETHSSVGHGKKKRASFVPYGHLKHKSVLEILLSVKFSGTSAIKKHRVLVWVLNVLDK